MKKPEIWNAESLKELRRFLKLSQAELAQELGTSQQVVSTWECGLLIPGRSYQKIITYTAQKLLEAKNVSFSG